MEKTNKFEKNKCERKKTIILHATALFLEKDIESIKMTDIAKSSKTGVASIYRYFGTKQKLVIEVGINLWESINKEYERIYNSVSYLNETGINQCKSLLNIFNILAENKSLFLKFNYDFDRYVAKEHISKDDLASYEKVIIHAQQRFLEAVYKGRADNTVRSDFDEKIYYLAFTHSLFALTGKVNGPNILKSDDFQHGQKEVEVVINSFINYIEKK